MKKSFLSLFSLLILFAACSKDDIPIDPDNLLIGVWNLSEYKDNSLIFTRNDQFVDNHCYRFNSDGTMTERKNSGFCGTPPVTYADYPGSWTVINDTLVQITVGYWGGTSSYKLYIEHIDLNSLTATYVFEDNQLPD